MRPQAEILRRLLHVAVCLLCAGLLAPSSSRAAEDPPPAGAEPGRSAVIAGEIVDPAGYLRDGLTGTDLVDMTYAAVEAGQTLAILEEGSKTLYLLLAETPGDDPNELVYDYVNQAVRVTGMFYERGGLRGIVPASVELLNPEDGAPN